MSVNITKLKEILETVIGPDFKHEGFTFNKSEFSFNKKVAKNKIRCPFLFYNYAPVRVEYSFAFFITVHEIEEEKKRFCQVTKRDYSKSFSYSIAEGVLHPKVKNEIAKIQTAFTHVITDFERDAPTIDDSRNILRTEFFPRLSIFSNFKRFQTYILSNYDFITKGGMLYPAIIAAKLKDKESFDKITEYIWIKENLNSKPDGHALKKWLVDFIAYSEEYPKPAARID